MPSLAWPISFFAANVQEGSGIFSDDLQVKVRLGMSTQHMLMTSTNLDKYFYSQYKS